MTSSLDIDRIITSRRDLSGPDARVESGSQEAEGGCGVIGIACSEQIPARHLLQALQQMRNRGNNKGGGIAAVGLVPEEQGVSAETLERDYLLAIAYLDPSARAEVERQFVEPTFEVDVERSVPAVADFKSIFEEFFDKWQDLRINLRSNFRILLELFDVKGINGILSEGSPQRGSGPHGVFKSLLPLQSLLQRTTISARSGSKQHCDDDQSLHCRCVTPFGADSSI